MVGWPQIGSGIPKVCPRPNFHLHTFSICVHTCTSCTDSNLGQDQPLEDESASASSSVCYFSLYHAVRGCSSLNCPSSSEKGVSVLLRNSTLPLKSTELDVLSSSPYSCCSKSMHCCRDRSGLKSWLHPRQCAGLQR